MNENVLTPEYGIKYCSVFDRFDAYFPKKWRENVVETILLDHSI